MEPEVWWRWVVVVVAEEDEVQAVEAGMIAQIQGVRQET